MDRLVEQILDGKWGNGLERRRRLEARGYNYQQVQALVNEAVRSRLKANTLPEDYYKKELEKARAEVTQLRLLNNDLSNRLRSAQDFNNYYVGVIVGLKGEVDGEGYTKR